MRIRAAYATARPSSALRDSDRSRRQPTRPRHSGWFGNDRMGGAADVANIILLFVCLVLGVVLGLTKRFPENAHLALNAFILHISLPALIFLYIHNVQFR